MKIFFVTLLACFFYCQIFAQSIEGIVRTAINKQPVAGASISFKLGQIKTSTNDQGYFKIKSENNSDTLIIDYIGLQTQLIPVANINRQLDIYLVETANILNEVNVNTGYYQVAKERATGSFVQIDNNLLNRSVSNNILDRLENVASGLQFDRRSITAENALGRAAELRVRGLSTILGVSSPLIVVDNFPYEGDINSINPNDVESVTVLKDAAAASIWGARAGNGVIVINTKQGKYNQKTLVSFNSSINMMDKPDLYYGRNYLPSETVMGIQEELFKRKGYAEANNTYIPAYVELLIKQRDKMISEEDFNAQKIRMQRTDFRNEALNHLYQNGLAQQYNLNASGGGTAYKFYLSAGYDRSESNVIGNSDHRINLNFQNTFKITSKLEANANIWYSQQNGINNGINATSLGSGVREPYTLLADEQGNALATGYSGRRLLYQEQAINNKLLDWTYRPLNEVNLIDKTSGRNEIRINTGLKYNFLPHLNLNTTYQYIRGNSESQTYYDINSYYTRDLVNSFTQANGQQIIPNGSILNGLPVNKFIGHSGRVQLNYSQIFSSVHDLTFLAGAEAGQQTADQFPGFRLYNHSKEYLGGTNSFDYTKSYPVLPLGVRKIERPAGTASRSNNRNLSYFSNVAYVYKNRYSFSGSARWDGSNLLGVKTNQRGTLLWSSGASWEISKENFYSQNNWLSYLRLRTTYGSGGLIDKTQSQYPTIEFYNDDRTGLRMAELKHPGNPSLKWERVNTLNVGLDWSSEEQRFSGTFEWYNKKGKDLLGTILNDPTTGADANYKQNYADLKTNGIDLQLNSINTKGALIWSTSLLMSFTQNKITNYNTPPVTYTQSYLTTAGKPPVNGRSVDVLYALPWNGLDHNTGLPLIYTDGKITTDYLSYINTYKVQDLAIAGVEVPPYFGSLRNTVEWQGIQLSALIGFKFGYVFRRSSMEPGAEFQVASPGYHTDYYLRWKQPGDELNTNVPAYTPTYDSSVATVYSQSMALITSGNQVRLQDVNLSYNLPTKLISRLHFSNVRFYLYARNLGILWRQNKFSIDPDYPYAEYPAPKTIALGLQVNL